MRYAFSCDQVRELESAAIARVGADTLMQRAADGLAKQAIRLLQETRGAVYGAVVLLLIGPGNNGGDALFAGERLARRGCRVLAVPAIGQPHRAGSAALLAAGGRLVELAGLAERLTTAAAGVAAADRRQRPDRAPDLVVDGLLGIGGRPGLPAPVAALGQALAVAGLPIISVDLPSGVAADSGQVPAAAVAATQTVTFGGLKPCHLVTPAAEYAGAVTVVDIGLQTQPDPGSTLAPVAPLLAGWEPADVAAQWPVPGSGSDKYSRGVVGVNTGSTAYPGAGVLSTLGAVYGGAGMVRFCGDPTSAALIRAELPNVVFGPGRCQTWLAGSGWGERPNGAELIGKLLAQVGAAPLESAISLVIDADGLRYLPTGSISSGMAERVLLTPHDGELARLLQRPREAIAADRIAAVRQGAEETGATVLLKGATQLIATPGASTIEVAVRGPGWTGQAGSGDVLGGLCAALLAAGLPARTAAALAASAQAMAAASFPGPTPPQDLARRCAEIIGGFAATVTAGAES